MTVSGVMKGGATIAEGAGKCAARDRIRDAPADLVADRISFVKTVGRKVRCAVKRLRILRVLSTSDVAMTTCVPHVVEKARCAAPAISLTAKTVSIVAQKACALHAELSVGLAALLTAQSPAETGLCAARTKRALNAAPKVRRAAAEMQPRATKVSHVATEPARHVAQMASCAAMRWMRPHVERDWDVRKTARVMCVVGKARSAALTTMVIVGKGLGARVARVWRVVRKSSCAALVVSVMGTCGAMRRMCATHH